MIELGGMCLECELPTDLDNLIDNPSGQSGTGGWSTPIVGSTLEASAIGFTFTAADLGDPSGDQITTPQYVVTDPLPVVSGEYVAASWEVVASYLPGGGPGKYVQRLEFLAFNGIDVVSATAPTASAPAAEGVFPQTAPVVVPAGVSYVRLRLDPRFFGAALGAAIGQKLVYRRAVVAVADDPLDLSGAVLQDYVDPEWVNILGPSRRVNISRRPLDLGTLTAEILDPALDPAVAETLRPGRQARFRLATADGWDDIFVGKVDQLHVDLRPYVITLRASDAMSPLSATPRSNGVATVEELAYVLEGTGVSWSLNGDASQPAGSPDVVSVNANAYAADQVAMTRDVVRGYGWVDRHGVVTVNDQAHMATDVIAVLDESVYNPMFEADFGTSTVINSVKVDVITIDGGTLTYGPYEDTRSIRDWTRQSKTFTLHLAETDPATRQAAVTAFADAVLAANATPQRVPRKVVVPINHLLIEFYDGGSFAAPGSLEFDGGTFATVAYPDDLDGGTL